MSFFGSLFSGKNDRNLAKQQALQAQQTQAAIDARLMAGQADALGAINAGEPLSLGSIERGYTAARPLFDDARARFEPYVADGRRADGVYEDSLGLNGQAGYDRTVSTYREGPGYREAVDAATDEVMRKGGAGGWSLNGGNVINGVAQKAREMKDLDFGQWQGQVRGIGDRGFDAAGRMGAVDTTQAGFERDYGRDQADIYGGNAGRRAGVYTGTTAAAVGALSDLGKERQEANKTGFGASAKAGTNTMNALLGVGNTLASLAGSFYGGRPATPTKVG